MLFIFFSIIDDDANAAAENDNTGDNEENADIDEDAMSWETDSNSGVD